MWGSGEPHQTARPPHSGRSLAQNGCVHGRAQTGGPRTDGGLFSGVDALVSGILPDSIDDNNSRICGAADLSSGHRWALSTRKNRRQTAVATIREPANAKRPSTALKVPIHHTDGTRLITHDD